MSGDDEQATQADVSELPTQASSPAIRLHGAETSILPPTPARASRPPSRPSIPPTKAPSTTGSASGATTVGSPLEALERDEIVRTRWFCFVAVGISLLGAGSVPLLPGDPTMSALLLSSIGVTLVAIAFLYRRTFDPLAFRKPGTTLGWFVPAACVTAAIPYYGVFSPVSVLFVLGIYFTGLGKNSRLSYAVYGAMAGMQLLVATLVISGERDTGLVRADDLSTTSQIIIQALVQMVFVATLITARMSRRTALSAVSELERAVRTAAHREALLLEAREELERALRSGRGRFTDQTIGGFRLGAVLGRGAMGEVYAAEDDSGRRVAIKLLSQASLGNPNHVLRFLRELRTVATLRSPNIVEVIEVGEAPVPYLVMERLEGQNLAEIMRGRRTLPTADVVELVTQIGAGITAAFAAGIVHRDLKPQNVFLHHGTWKVLDFGVARAMDAGDTLTAGQVVGTPSYMAPEQANGGAVDHLTDLYALASIVYRAITGHPPFAAGEIAETLYRVVHTRPRRPSNLADIPTDVDLVLAIGMAKDPERRFATANELATALAAAFAGTLPDHIAERGRVLERAGAWASPTTRAQTKPMRPPR